MNKCLECGKDFKPKSKAAKFCSNKCRQSNYRKNLRELLKDLRSSKIVSSRVIKKDGQHIAEIGVQIKANKNRELNDFWKQRMKNKLGI